MTHTLNNRTVYSQVTYKVHISCTEDITIPDDEMDCLIAHIKRMSIKNGVGEYSMLYTHKGQIYKISYTVTEE